jgi:hypothetical protein
MSTPISYLISDLDAEIQAQVPAWANRSDYTTLRNRAYRRALGEYSDGLTSQDDIFIRADCLASPVSLGSAPTIATTPGVIFQIALPAGALRVAGDSIMIQKSSTTEFFNVPRMAWANIVPSGSGQTPYGFWENNGIINIYTTTSDFDHTAGAAFDYYRQIDATQSPTSTAMDIKYEDFDQLVDTTISFLQAYLNN